MTFLFGLAASIVALLGLAVLVRYSVQNGIMLQVGRQGFYKYLINKDRPWKYQPLAEAMLDIREEDECNDTCGCIRRNHQSGL